ncbi:MAG: hypothetical protein MK179_09775 [Pirellulaceae bacterium]|nr:hypothetical protein [Pirellulaceae bacterium]
MTQPKNSEPTECLTAEEVKFVVEAIAETEREEAEKEEQARVQQRKAA